MAHSSSRGVGNGRQPTIQRRYGEPHTDWNETDHTHLAEGPVRSRRIRNSEAVTIAEGVYNGTPEGS